MKQKKFYKLLKSILRFFQTTKPSLLLAALHSSILTLILTVAMPGLAAGSAPSIGPAPIGNFDINQAIKQSPNGKPISDFIWQTLNTQSSVLGVKFKDGRKLSVEKSGLNRAEIVTLKDPIGTRELFSTATLSRNGSYHITALELSPDELHVALSFEYHGSLDSFEVRIYDVLSLKESHRILNVADADLIWRDSDQLVFSQRNANKNEKEFVYRLSTKSQTDDDDSILYRGTGGWTAQNESEWFLINTSGLKIGLKNIQLLDLFGGVENGVIVQTQIEELQQKIEIVSTKPQDIGSVRTLRDLGLDVAAKVKIHDNTVILEMKNAGRHWIELIDSETGHLQRIDFPECAFIKNLAFNTKGDKLEVELKSSVNSGTFHFNLKTNQWDEADIQGTLTRFAGVDYSIELVNARSQDGTLIPMRVTRAKNLKMDGARPVVLEVYGGFGIDGRIDSGLNKIEINFVNQGGIFAAPGVRGGGEIGGDWHMQAKKVGKHLTMDDFKACADWFSPQWSNPRLIISTGTSNGGFTVASAGLLYPDHFGLVIPVSGVHDLLNKEILDPMFGEGWKYEYGDSRIAEDHAYLQAISPVELAKLGKMPDFLIISGIDDSRVNHLHSDRLYQTLREHQEPGKFVRMIQIKSSGHWVTSMPYQDIIAWRANSAKWITIYDYVGMTFQKTQAK